ncbi:NAD(+)/NADH kinase [Peptostreptococcus sp.]|uniref:NAD(+)/NADH kinase n=1 Tax=Peptostreptococcus sp. TaxID=1262 RepID=UPI0025E6A404|nr:NAD(+)/NADH kinase [Peptostreptococcus sp.]
MGCMNNMARNVVIKSNELEISKNIKKILIDKFLSVGFNTSEEIRDNTELVISIGGDGSFLRNVRDLNFPDIPFFCVNTGHLGFFAEILPTEKEIDIFIDAYLNSTCEINELYLLEVDIKGKYEVNHTYAINELVVRGNQSRTAHMGLHVNGNYMETFSGDGLIMSTSTGSTAYNYSAGGSIVDNRLNIIQITPISPISTNAFRSFTSSIILPGQDSEIAIKPEYKSEHTIITVVDGQEHKFNDVYEINVRNANKTVKLLRLSDYEFWDRVYMKFLKTYDYKTNEARI